MAGMTRGPSGSPRQPCYPRTYPQSDSTFFTNEAMFAMQKVKPPAKGGL
jgi:hypothetical protein